MYLLYGVIFVLHVIAWTYLDSVGKTLVFSDDNVFSYNRVERRCIIPPPLLGPTVWLPLAGSNLEVVLAFAGLDVSIDYYVRKIMDAIEFNFAGNQILEKKTYYHWMKPLWVELKWAVDFVPNGLHSLLLLKNQLCFGAWNCYFWKLTNNENLTIGSNIYNKLFNILRKNGINKEYSTIWEREREGESLTTCRSLKI